MKIAVLSDIHGNSTALKAVLDDLPNVDDIISLGDVVGYGPRPSTCVKIIRKKASISLYGNHEDYISSPEKIQHNNDGYRGIQHTINELSEEQIEWATTRPMRYVVDGTMQIAHGHPNPDQPYKYVKPSNVTELIPHFEEEETLLAVGHSHYQFKQDLSKFPGSGGTAFNPGSVGQPRDGDHRAAYAIVDTDTGEVTLKRTEYDIESVIKQVEKAGLPEDNGKRLWQK